MLEFEPIHFSEILNELPRYYENDFGGLDFRDFNTSKTKKYFIEFYKKNNYMPEEFYSKNKFGIIERAKTIIELYKEKYGEKFSDIIAFADYVIEKINTVPAENLQDVLDYLDGLIDNFEAMLLNDYYDEDPEYVESVYYLVNEFKEYLSKI